MKLTKTHDEGKQKNPELTLVMIHGIASGSWTYDNTMKYLNKHGYLDRIRAVTFDLLGCGESTKDDNLNYDYKDQLGALHASIEDLEIGDSPLILVGHSLGTFIVTRYASTYKDEVSELVLISPPVYTPEDFENPAFKLGMEAFKQSVSAGNPGILEEKSFKNSMEKIVLDKDNYRVLAEIDVPTTLIYGDGDGLIASDNIPELLEQNNYISAIETKGRHGVTEDKYQELAKVLERRLND